MRMKSYASRAGTTTFLFLFQRGINFKIGTGGFEPPTPCMSSKYSTPELRAY